MNVCRNCNIKINDDIDVCPLCHSVLDEMTEDEKKIGVSVIRGGSDYPDVRKREKTLGFVMRLILFLFIVTEATLIIVNKAVTPGFWWSGISGVAMVYTYLSLVYWIRHDSGFATKIGLQLFLTVALLFAIDYFTGMIGWSIKYAIPGVILLGDALVFFLMMLNRQHWYSYTLLLLFIGLCSVAILFLFLTKRITNVVLPVTCVAVTDVYLLGTIIFGDREFTRELKRRFHV
ncbi:MAG: hypothetical protein E7271_11695 [Lachnospiraceae bacterium]|jgi:hypothetical protein|nr:hypothetical protein [Lachnospiraceae bacterium]